MSSEPTRYTVLSHKTILVWAILIVTTGTGLAVWLLLAYGHDDPLGAIRTAGTVVVGSGGAAALLLAARRQRSTEIALQQKDQDQADVARAYKLQEQVAADTRADAVQRRITELYTRAVEQLGSDKASVRLGGLYALERLAQDNEHQRQTIANVLCAYLRMPYQLPTDDPTDEQLQEREVRLTAQRLLVTHTQLDSPGFWSDIDLDLTGATLIDFTMTKCALRSVSFTKAKFCGDAWFYRMTFPKDTDFEEATFANKSYFLMATFSGNTRFDNATFSGDTSFGDPFLPDSAKFTRAADFRSATFNSTFALMRRLRPRPSGLR